ncbi:phospholipid scramblase 1-like isoform X2 [Rhinatrema bivittatum]|nr:phospholipid scramblase 1-like isoform X2 [Rhinatrema bivittatum]XP_029436916.1 phospholipid scramblase 1-like isoform X2 [Rhinatrema bivittatum]XP_029436917.1 phospholipid scramblase 1-like isoform X2 [Rhinatrema bivittatum]
MEKSDRHHPSNAGGIQVQPPQARGGPQSSMKMDPPTVIVPYMPPITGVPPGLEYMTQIDQILVHQKVELVEVLTGCETNNKYEVRNSMGQTIFLAKEDTDCCTRFCWGSLRPFNMQIMDHSGREVIHIYRPLKCGLCCFPCCLQEMEVQSPPGVPIGYIVQNWHICKGKFSIQNAARETILKVVGPCCVCRCCADINFEVMTIDELQIVGRLSKQWSGLAKEMFTKASNFGIQFPVDLDVKMKAVMLGATFLIDFMFFENE